MLLKRALKKCRKTYYTNTGHAKDENILLLLSAAETKTGMIGDGGVVVEFNI